jgi:hypothetical protein
VLIETQSGGYLEAVDDGTLTTAVPRAADNNPDNMPSPQEYVASGLLPFTSTIAIATCRVCVCVWIKEKTQFGLVGAVIFSGRYQLSRVRCTPTTVTSNENTVYSCSVREATCLEEDRKNALRGV